MLRNTARHNCIIYNSTARKFGTGKTGLGLASHLSPTKEVPESVWKALGLEVSYNGCIRHWAADTKPPKKIT